MASYWLVQANACCKIRDPLMGTAMWTAILDAPLAYGTPHVTGPNRTDKERAGLALHFLRVDYAQDELIAPDRDHRPYLTGPNATAGRREYGEVMAGTWEREVERALETGICR